MVNKDNVVKDFEKEFRILVNSFKNQNFNVTQEALKIASEEMAKRLMVASPSNTGLFKSSWKVKQYTNVCYVYNNRGAGGIDKGIPLTNVIEYSRRGPQPFINSLWEKNKNEIKELFIKEFERRMK